MSNSETLPIYMDCYRLVGEVFRLTVAFSREHKFLLGASLNNDVLSLCVLILQANRSENKVKPLENFVALSERVQVQIHLCTDLNLINNRQKMRLLHLIEGIMKQGFAWLKSERRKTV